MKNGLKTCNKIAESGIIGTFDNQQDNELKLTLHQFQIVLKEMPRLGPKMREAMKRVMVGGELQKNVADNLAGVTQHQLSRNLTVFRDIFIAKARANGFIVRTVMIPEAYETIVDDLEFKATQHLLENQKIGKQLKAKKEEPNKDLE